MKAELVLLAWCWLLAFWLRHFKELIHSWIGQCSSLRVLGVSHREAFPSRRHPISARPSRAPALGTQELMKCAESLGATGGRGRGHSSTPTLPRTAPHVKASSGIPSQTWGGKWAGPLFRKAQPPHRVT